MTRHPSILTLALLLSGCVSGPAAPGEPPTSPLVTAKASLAVSPQPPAVEVQPHQQIVRRTGEFRRRIAERCLSQYPTAAPVDGDLVVQLGGEGEVEMVSLQCHRDPDLSAELEACITEDVTSWNLPAPRTRELRLGWALHMDGEQVDLERPSFGIFVQGALSWQTWQPVHMGAAISSCFSRAWKVGEHGDVLMEYEVATDGTVERVAIPESDIRSEEVLTCMREAYAELRFPEAEGPTYVLAPIRLLSASEMEAQQRAQLEARPPHWQFRWRIRDFEATLRDCARQHPIEDLQMGTLNLKVDGEGAIEASMACGTPEAVPEGLRACIVEQARAWELPAPKADRWLVSMEIDMGPGGVALYPPAWGFIVDGALDFDQVFGATSPDLGLASCMKEVRRLAETQFALIDYTIGPDGRVIEVNVAESSLQQPQAEACVARAIAETAYPSSTGETFVQMPLTVWSKQDEAWMKERIAAKKERATQAAASEPEPE